MRRDLAIVGGGPVGTVVGLLLADRGYDVTIVSDCTSARTDEEARELLKGFNFPFRS